MPRRLDGRTVVVTRGAGGDDALAAALRALGAEVRELPSISTAAPEDGAPLDEALRALDRFAWVAFASATAVERVVERLDALAVPRGALAGRRLACVGAATAARLGDLVRAPDLVPEVATGAALAGALGPLARGRAVLVPRAAEGRPELLRELAAAGAEVVAPVAYRTVPVAPAALAPLGDLLEAGEVDAVAFASPSAVRSVAAALGARRPLLARALLAAIGPTTAGALAAEGLRAGAVPARSGASELAAAVAEALGPGPRSAGRRRRGP